MAHVNELLELGLPKGVEVGGRIKLAAQEPSNTTGYIKGNFHLLVYPWPLTFRHLLGVWPSTFTTV